MEPNLEKIGGEHLTNDYYENYNSFFDLAMMGDRIKELLKEGDGLEKFRNKKEGAAFLVLGSATTKNVNGVTGIVHYLHGKNSTESDTVSIIDINDNSIQAHQQAVLDLDTRSDWSGKTMREQSGDSFPYPQFNVEKGDIRKLQNKSDSIDAVISDYTINYLGSVEDVQKCFLEIYRVLKDEGLLFIALRYSNKGSGEFLQGGIPIYKFTLDDYINIAKDSGLKIVRSEGSLTSSSEDILIILQKQSVGYPDRYSKRF